MSRPPPPGLETVLGKAVAILDAFTCDDSLLSLAELCRRTGLAKGTAHRVATDLVGTGLLDRHGVGYRLSTRLFAMGMRASVELGLMEVATPFLEDLYEHTHETVHLGVRADLDVVYLIKIGGHRQAAAPSRVGGRMPMHCTAIGKTLLAHADADVLAGVLHRGLDRRAPRTISSTAVLRRQLQTIREKNIAYEHEESAVGIHCIAAPITDATGVVVAAVSVTGPTTRFVAERHWSQVRSAAEGISATLARRAALQNKIQAFHSPEHSATLSMSGSARLRP